MCRFSPPGCSRLCRVQRYARLGAPLRASRAGVCRGACCGGWRVGLCWRGGPPGRALSAHSPPLTDGGSARRARRRGRPSPPALRCAALAGPPRLRAAALFRSGGPPPCGRPRALPSPPVGGGRALPVAAAPAVVGGFWGRPLLVGPRRVPPLAALALAASRRCGSAALRWPCRAGSGLAFALGPAGRPRLLRSGGLAAGRRGRLARPRVGCAAPLAVKVKVKVKGKGKPLFAAPGAAPPVPRLLKAARPRDVLTIPKLLILYLTSPFKRGILGIGRASPHGSR